MLCVLHVKFLWLRFVVIVVVFQGLHTIAAVAKYLVDLIPRTNPVRQESSVRKEPGRLTSRRFLTAQVDYPEPFSGN